MKDILSQLLPYVITAVVGYVGSQIVKIVPSAINLIVAKIGLTNYQKMKTVACDIWNSLEEDGRLGELALSKIKAFEVMLKNRFPNISDADIRLLNKAIAGELNKDKPVIKQAIEEPTVVTVPGVVKYVAPDGSELVPATTTSIQ